MRKKVENLPKTTIKIRIAQAQKQKWKAYCLESGITLTDCVISSVERRMTEREKRSVIRFIEKQDNLYARIENNINQFAKVAHQKQMVSQASFDVFLSIMKEVLLLKGEQNAICLKIYRMLRDGGEDT